MVFCFIYCFFFIRSIGCRNHSNSDKSDSTKPEEQGNEINRVVKVSPISHSVLVGYNWTFHLLSVTVSNHGGGLNLEDRYQVRHAWFTCLVGVSTCVQVECRGRFSSDDESRKLFRLHGNVAAEVYWKRTGRCIKQGVRFQEVSLDGTLCCINSRSAGVDRDVLHGSSTIAGDLSDCISAYINEVSSSCHEATCSVDKGFRCDKAICGSEHCIVTPWKLSWTVLKQGFALVTGVHFSSTDRVVCPVTVCNSCWTIVGSVSFERGPANGHVHWVSSSEERTDWVMPSKQPTVEGLTEVRGCAETRHQKSGDEWFACRSVDRSHHQCSHCVCSIGVNAVKSSDCILIPGHWSSWRWWVCREVEWRCESWKFPIKENCRPGARGQSEWSIESVTGECRVESNCVSTGCAECGPSSTEVEAVVEVSAVDWVFSTKGGVDKQRSSHVTRSTKENHWQALCVSVPGTDPHGDSIVSWLSKSVCRHCSSIVHLKEGSNSVRCSCFVGCKKSEWRLSVAAIEQEVHGDCVIHWDSEVGHSNRGVDCVSISKPVSISPTKCGEGSTDSITHCPVSGDDGIKVWHGCRSHCRIIPKRSSLHGSNVRKPISSIGHNGGAVSSWEGTAVASHQGCTEWSCQWDVFATRSEGIVHGGVGFFAAEVCAEVIIKLVCRGVIYSSQCCEESIIGGIEVPSECSRCRSICCVWIKPHPLKDCRCASKAIYNILCCRSTCLHAFNILADHTSSECKFCGIHDSIDGHSRCSNNLGLEGDVELGDFGVARDLTVNIAFKGLHRVVGKCACSLVIWVDGFCCGDVVGHRSDLSVGWCSPCHDFWEVVYGPTVEITLWRWGSPIVICSFTIIIVTGCIFREGFEVIIHCAFNCTCW